MKSIRLSQHYYLQLYLFLRRPFDGYPHTTNDTYTNRQMMGPTNVYGRQVSPEAFAGQTSFYPGAMSTDAEAFSAKQQHQTGAGGEADPQDLSGGSIQRLTV